MDASAVIKQPANSSQPKIGRAGKHPESAEAPAKYAHTRRLSYGDHANHDLPTSVPRNLEALKSQQGHTGHIQRPKFIARAVVSSPVLEDTSQRLPFAKMHPQSSPGLFPTVPDPNFIIFAHRCMSYGHVNTHRLVDYNFKVAASTFTYRMLPAQLLDLAEALSLPAVLPNLRTIEVPNTLTVGFTERVMQGGASYRLIQEL
ncbi:hypothetical protein DFH07DRAFT_1067829 [Mycena maculata]|uniref:Uncharacterized protein n=1 Tax=Mycena maculata TaxID=230809 RepID=A0AAD7MJP5_9AGAR|nr:hypothetical protein DFH07DRAFT_1067829 [Mycena maculata]